MQICLLLLLVIFPASYGQRHVHTPRPDLMADIFAQAPSLVQAALQNAGLAPRPLRGPSDYASDSFRPPQQIPSPPAQVLPPPHEPVPSRYNPSASETQAAVLPAPPIARDRIPEASRVIFPTRQSLRTTDKVSRPARPLTKQSVSRSVIRPTLTTSGYQFQAYRTATPSPTPTPSSSKDRVEASISSPPLKPFSVQTIKYEYGFRPMNSDTNSINVFSSGTGMIRRQKAAPPVNSYMKRKFQENHSASHRIPVVSETHLSPATALLQESESVERVRIHSNQLEPTVKKGKEATTTAPEPKPVVTLSFDCKGGNDLGWCVLGDRYPRAEVDQVVRECEEVFERLYVESPEEILANENNRSEISAPISPPGTKIRRPIPVVSRGSSGTTTSSRSSWSWSGYEQVQLCSSDEKAIRPAFAKDIKGEWLVIVQTEQYIQKLKIDSCRNPDGPCSRLQGCGRKSKCIQKHTHHRLIAIDPARPQDCPAMRLFKFPTACVCNYIADRH